LISVAMVAASALMVLASVATAPALAETPGAGRCQRAEGITERAHLCVHGCDGVAEYAELCAHGCDGTPGGSPVDEVELCSPDTRCWSEPRALRTEERALATAASALPSATAEVAGACPVTAHGLTVAGQLAEIRAGDLAFTIAEAAC
jgi:hypothetical protein